VLDLRLGRGGWFGLGLALTGVTAVELAHQPLPIQPATQPGGDVVEVPLGVAQAAGAPW
jgi:hypothetical protein